MTIVLGYAPLRLPCGPPDVGRRRPRARALRADDGGRGDRHRPRAAGRRRRRRRHAPDREHAAVLRALGVREGVVAVTKADLADPVPGAGGGRDLLGGDRGWRSSRARRGRARASRRSAPRSSASRRRPRRARCAGGPAVLHVDRSFTVRGAGTVVTGTLWSGTIGAGDVLALLPGGRRARVRGVEVHDEPRRARRGRPARGGRTSPASSAPTSAAATCWPRPARCCAHPTCSTRRSTLRGERTARACTSTTARARRPRGSPPSAAASAAAPRASAARAARRPLRRPRPSRRPTRSAAARPRRRRPQARPPARRARPARARCAAGRRSPSPPDAGAAGAAARPGSRPAVPRPGRGRPAAPPRRARPRGAPPVRGARAAPARRPRPGGRAPRCPPERWVMHCFSGDVDFARACLDRGAYLCFAGTVTFKNAQPLRNALVVVPARPAAGGDRRALPDPRAVARPPQRVVPRAAHDAGDGRGPRGGPGGPLCGCRREHGNGLRRPLVARAGPFRAFAQAGDARHVVPLSLPSRCVNCRQWRSSLSSCDCWPDSGFPEVLRSECFAFQAGQPQSQARPAGRPRGASWPSQSPAPPWPTRP